MDYTNADLAEAILKVNSRSGTYIETALRVVKSYPNIPSKCTNGTTPYVRGANKVALRKGIEALFGTETLEDVETDTKQLRVAA